MSDSIKKYFELVEEGAFEKEGPYNFVINQKLIYNRANPLNFQPLVNRYVANFLVGRKPERDIKDIFVHWMVIINEKRLPAI